MYWGKACAACIAILWVVAALLGGGPAVAAPGTAAAVPSRCTVTSGTYTNFSSGGDQRSYTIRIPPGGAGPKTPMVVSLHGASGNAASQQNTSGLSVASESPAEVQAATDAMIALGDREGFIAVFPQSTGISPYTWWNLDVAGRDVPYVAELVSFLQSRGCSSAPVTSINGFSMGAMLTSRLLCRAPGLFGGGGVMVAGVLPPVDGCQAAERVPTAVIHSPDDPIVKWDGSGYSGYFLEGLPYLVWPGFPLTRAEMAASWAEAKDCPSPGFSKHVGEVTATDLSCPWSTTMMITYDFGGHVWNGPGFNASEFIWALVKPQAACQVSAPAAPGPGSAAFAAALKERVATDEVFAFTFGRTLKTMMTCNAWVDQALRSAILWDMAIDPNGYTAQVMRFSFAQYARRGA